MMNKIILTLVASLLFAAQSYAGEVTVSDAWARATAPGQKVGLVGLTITSQKDGRLLAATSPASASVEIHTMSMDNGIMKMRQLDDLPLTAKQPATLGMEGNHLMLINLKHALKPGENVPVTITVQFADKSTEKIKINALVRPIATNHDQHHNHH